MTRSQTPTFTVPIEVYGLLRAMRRYLDRRARNLGFTQEQWRTLWHLDKNQGITQAGLAEILEIQPISLARTLDRLATSGLIERRPDPRDRRAQQLFLTAAADPILEALAKIGEEFRSVASNGLSEDQQAQMIAQLRHMRANIDKHEEAGLAEAGVA